MNDQLRCNKREDSENIMDSVVLCGGPCASAGATVAQAVVRGGITKWGIFHSHRNIDSTRELSTQI